jgi:hypothetical protein
MDANLIDPASYIDIAKISKLIELVENFSKKDPSKHWIDVSEKVIDISLNWKSIIVYDKTGNYEVSDEVKISAGDIIEYAAEISGLNRITINFLLRYSFMPIHTDTPEKADYDFSNTNFNMIVPCDNNGWSIVDYKVIKNKKGVPLVFDGQVPHGAMNDTGNTRLTAYLLLDKKYFKNDCA